MIASGLADRFRRRDKAEQLLKTALQLNPMASTACTSGAITFTVKSATPKPSSLQKALQAAPDRAGKPLTPGVARKSRHCWWT
jgi:hypothetical protein